MTIHEYIDQLEQDASISTFIEGDRDAEINYVRSSLSRFDRIARSVPDSDTPLRVLDIGTTPFTLYIKQTHPHYEVSTLDRTDMMAERCRQAITRLLRALGHSTFFSVGRGTLMAEPWLRAGHEGWIQQGLCGGRAPHNPRYVRWKDD